MIDFSTLSAIVIMVLVVIFIKFVMPFLKKNNIDFYEEVRIGSEM